MILEVEAGCEGVIYLHVDIFAICQGEGEASKESTKKL